ncbi:conserved exported hypothetical protein [Candidatus Zixiibacteriota bacterium]|nr:conserved exported hypothetical protein [candidate division Zixibacteria bacterium]
MLRTRTLAFSIFVLLLIGTMARADSFGLISGALSTAEASGFGNGYLGVFGAFGDNANSFFGTISYGFSNYTDGRFKIGFSDPDGPGTNPQLFIATDLKYQFMNYNDKSHKQPLDMAVGGLLEYVDYDPVTMLQLGGFLTGSIPYRFNNGTRLIPYGRLNFRLERASYDGHSQSDFEAGLNLGTKYEWTHDVNMYGEIQIDGNTSLYLGMEFRAF